MAILFGIWGLPLLVIVFLSGLSALMLVGFIARINGRSEIVTVILSGMIVGAMFSALVSLTQFLADPDGPLPAIVYWLMARLPRPRGERLFVAAPGLAVGMILLWALRFRLNILSLDEAEARSLAQGPISNAGLFLYSSPSSSDPRSPFPALSAGSVWSYRMRRACSSGTITARCCRPRCCWGAAYLVAVDTLARTMTAAEIPLGILTALVGAPVFAMLLRNHYRDRSSK